MAEQTTDLARARAAVQLLGRPKQRTPVVIVRHLLAVQAQDFASVPLALRARSRGLAREDVHAALDSGDLVISWLNRGTLHLVCREDYWWLHALTAPTTRTANQRRLGQEGVTNPGREVRRIAKLLEDGPLLRPDIGERIGISGQALTHLLLAASLDGLVVRGPLNGAEQTFILARDHIGEPEPVDRETAFGELGRRYLAGHAPASEADLAYWAGLPLRDARAAMKVHRSKALTPLDPDDIPPKLLPPFDPYILGWKDRSFAIPAAIAKRVMPGGGMFRAVVLVAGRVAGTWSRAGGRVLVDGEGGADLASEVADVERFLG